jgi:hypothetical protein
LIRIGDGPRDRVRVIGSLEGPPLAMLLGIVGDGSLALDLSEVQEVDLEALGTLARLPGERFRLVACPKWLARAIARERQALVECEAEGPERGSWSSHARRTA